MPNLFVAWRRFLALSVIHLAFCVGNLFVLVDEVLQYAGYLA